MFVVKCKVSLGCKPNQTRFYGRVRYTDQPCLSPSAREKACSGEGALCSLLHLKDFKSCLVRRRKKKKGLNYEITSFCLKYFTQGKKKKKAQNKRAQKEKKKICSLSLTCSQDSAPRLCRMTPGARPQPLPLHNRLLVQGGWRPSCSPAAPEHRTWSWPKLGSQPGPRTGVVRQLLCWLLPTKGSVIERGEEVTCSHRKSHTAWDTHSAIPGSPGEPPVLPFPKQKQTNSSPAALWIS